MSAIRRLVDVETWRLRARHAARWMRDHPRRVRAIGTLTALLLIATAVIGPFVFDGDGRHLSAYADGARDLSRLRQELGDQAQRYESGEPRALATSPYFLTSLQDPRNAALFVVGVERPYTRGETQTILDFVRAGGTLVLANDVSYANRLSDEFGVAFGDKVILDSDRNYRNNPRIVEVVVPFDEREFRILMNAPAYATVTRPDALEVLATSSNSTFIDVNGDGQIGVPPDIAGQFPLVMRTTYGEGRVFVLADTGLFMNEMLAVPGYDNAAFARALAAVALDAGGPVLIDESRHVAPPASRAGDEALRVFVLATTTPTWRAVIAVAALAAVAGAVVLTRGTEDWSVHVFDVGHPRSAPEDLAPTPERLRMLAARAVSERYNIPLEYLDSASLEEVVRLTGDRELAAVAKGLSRVDDPRAFYRKLTDIVPTEVPITKEVST